MYIIIFLYIFFPTIDEFFKTMGRGMQMDALAHNALIRLLPGEAIILLDTNALPISSCAPTNCICAYALMLRACRACAISTASPLFSYLRNAFCANISNDNIYLSGFLLNNPHPQCSTATNINWIIANIVKKYAKLVGIDATDPNGFDDVVVQELHLPVGREIIFKMRSQDVLHSAYMPHFRAQMNCVPGMITEFAFTPVMTTEQMRQTPEMIAKVKKINKIRTKNSEELVLKGEEPLEPYIFDYILLCNKICGASHYNMQMKIIVETEDKFKKWMSNQQTFAQFIQ